MACFVGLVYVSMVDHKMYCYVASPARSESDLSVLRTFYRRNTVFFVHNVDTV
jgi:hypothetical protein